MDFSSIRQDVQTSFHIKMNNLVSTNKAFALGMPSLVLPLYSFLLTIKLISLIQEILFPISSSFMFFFHFYGEAPPPQHPPRKVWQYLHCFKSIVIPNYYLTSYQKNFQALYPINYYHKKKS